MRHFRRPIAKFKNLFRSGRADQDLAREISAHLAPLVDEFQRRGMSIEDARFEARRAYAA
jgi:hypothetical protein